MGRGMVACGAALITIAHIYFFSIMPFGPPELDALGRSAQELQLYAFTMYLLSLVGFLLISFVGIPRVGVRRRGRHDEEGMEGAGAALGSPRAAAELRRRRHR